MTQGQQRDLRAVQLRSGGASYEQIAEALNYKQRSAAYKAVVRGIRREFEQYTESVEMTRSISVQRLDKMLFSIWPDARAGDPAAIDRVLRLEQRRAALLGLDAPRTFEAKIRIDLMSWNEAIRDILDIYRELHENSEEADAFVDRIDALAQQRFAGVLE
jgi:hypothetical protein